MASYYGVLWESFWTGRTGRDLRRAGGKDAQILAAYLVSNRHANMLGLYRLSTEDIQHETGLRRREVEKALQVLEEVGFAKYDTGTEHVWVLTMVRFRLGLKPGEALGESDKRVLGVRRLYHGIADNPFLADFYLQSHAALRLDKPRDPQSVVVRVGMPSTSEGASKGLSSQVSGTSNQDQGSGSGTRSQDQEKAGRSATHRPQPVENDAVNVSVVTRLAHDVIADEGADASFADLADALKSRCAQLRVSLTPDAVTKAIESALHQRSRRRA